MTDIEFKGWPKAPRLFRDVVITEKIDGTNAAVGITKDGAIYAQSRTRIITPDADNFGFARWVRQNAGTLIDDLGPGLHFGEWWGSGIQRGYGLVNGERHFSLFNTAKWHEVREDFHTPYLGVVPILAAGPFSTLCVRVLLADLKNAGSAASPGFMNPEGICIYHTAARQVFKVLIENDELPKGATS